MVDIPVHDQHPGPNKTTLQSYGNFISYTQTDGFVSITQACTGKVQDWIEEQEEGYF